MFYRDEQRHRLAPVGDLNFFPLFTHHANQFAGFAAWVILFVVVIVVIDQLIFERAARRAFRWRDSGH